MKFSFRKIAATLLMTLMLILTLSVSGIISVPAFADCEVKGGINSALDPECSKGTGQASELTGDGGLIGVIINTMLFIIGILCVVMIIFAGIRYVTSTGDKNKVDAAKNTIVYAVVGLVVAIIAYALVNWVFHIFD
ncbi:pilin [Candidatus Saccharibacteria bacterium]|nr:pilin [Candidatus Saccharibacteria bacterium]